jgi:riboflavin synthase
VEPELATLQLLCSEGKQAVIHFTLHSPGREIACQHFMVSRHTAARKTLAFAPPLPSSLIGTSNSAALSSLSALTSIYGTPIARCTRAHCNAPPAANAARISMVFTGIVEEMGKVTAMENLDSADGGVTLDVTADVTVPGVALGDSISVNGTCLTVTVLTANGFKFGLAPETLRRTNLGKLTVGSSVNLERSLAADGRFGGHVVQGHVDTTGSIVSVARDKEAIVFEIEVEQSLMKYIVEKGYITVDGASLTVCEVSRTTFTFMMIAHTQACVVTATKVVGDFVNIEVDITGKYIEKIMAAHMPAMAPAVGPAAAT